MTREQAQVIVLALRAAYVYPAWDRATVDLYVSKIAMLPDPKIASNAIDSLIESERYRPSIAEIRAAYRARVREHSDDRGLPMPELSPTERTLNAARAKALLSRVSNSMGPTMAALPVTTRFRPRPLTALHARYMRGGEIVLTDEIKSDAIAYLRDYPEGAEELDPLYRMAEIVHVLATQETGDSTDR